MVSTENGRSHGSQSRTSRSGRSGRHSGAEVELMIHFICNNDLLDYSLVKNEYSANSYSTYKIYKYRANSHSTYKIYTSFLCYIWNKSHLMSGKKPFNLLGLGWLARTKVTQQNLPTCCTSHLFHNSLNSEPWNIRLIFWRTRSCSSPWAIQAPSLPLEHPGPALLSPT